MPLAAAAGRVAAEPVIPYPPGLPALLPGERIDAALVTALEAIVAGGGTIGGAGDGPPTLAVVAGGPRRTATAGALRRIRCLQRCGGRRSTRTGTRSVERAS